MSNFYQVTLNQGRTDTLTLEADSLFDVKTFFETVSTASITMIKKIVFSKDLGVGSATTSYTPNNQDNFLNIFVKNKKGVTGTLFINFPIKNISEDKIIKSVKKNLTLNGEPIAEVINIIKSVEGLAPTVGE
jgi:hypothetical protein